MALSDHVVNSGRSGAKGGLRHLAPEDVDALRDEVDATGVVRVSAGDAEPDHLRPADLGVSVLNEGRAPDTGYVVEDTEAVGEVLEELSRLRRGT